MSDKRMWAVLVHLGTNLWFEEGNNKESDGSGKVWKVAASPKMRFDRDTFDICLAKFQESGVNTIILDLADGIIYESHPELSIEDSLTRAEVQAMLTKIRGMGMEIIPKLNFSTTHDVWLKEYSRMVSTSVYYRVCEDLIKEVCEVFEPRYIHIGFDEEGIDCQKNYDYAVIRNNDLWWNDLKFFAGCVEKYGARSMMWSDYARHHLEEFIEKCPRSIVQCVWYYFNKFEGDEGFEELHRCRIAPLAALSKSGFDQLPVGSVEYDADNFEKLIKHCKENVSEERLLGYGISTWAMTTPEWQDFIFDAAEKVKENKY